MGFQPTLDKAYRVDDESNGQQGGGKDSKYFITRSRKDEVIQKTDEIDSH